MPEAALLWRLAVAATALVLVGAGLVGLVDLARAEWRRQRPDRGRYVRVVARFVIAFLLVLVATG